MSYPTPEFQLTAKTGRRLSLSHSAMESFDVPANPDSACVAKWWYGYVERIRGPQKEATYVGGRVHDFAEKYLLGKGTLDELEVSVEGGKRWRRILEPGLEYAPDPTAVYGGLWGVETRLDLIACGPLPMKGAIDFHTTDLNFHLKPTSTHVIGDWKTTGHREWRWSKTPESLATFNQPLLYAKGLVLSGKWEYAPPTVSFQHINLCTKGLPQAMEVWAHDVPWERVEENWEHAVEVATKMAEVRTGIEKVEDLEFNTRACSAYGGCEYAEICPMSPQNRKTQTLYTGEVPMASQEQLARQKALQERFGVKTTEAAAVTPAPEPPARKADQASGEDQLDKLLNDLLDKNGTFPLAVGMALASSVKASFTDAVSRLKLATNAETRTVSRREAEPAKPEAPTVEPGITIADAEALAKKVGVRLTDIAKASGLVPKLGMLLPPEFSGTASEAVRIYRPDSEEAALADALDEVDPPAPEPAAPEKAEGVVSLRPMDDFDEDVRKAAWALFEADLDPESDEGKEAAKAAAGWGRASKKRMEQVKEALAYIDNAPEEDLWVVPIEAEEMPTDTELAEDIDDGLEAPAPPVEEVVDFADPPVEEVVDFADLKEAAKDDQTAATRFVYVDAIPWDAPYQNFYDWITPFEDEVAEREGVNHVGIIDYGKGPKLVASLVMAVLHRDGADALPVHLVIDSSHPCATDVIPVLRRLKTTIFIKGVR